jgi:hypothetical protein
MRTVVASRKLLPKGLELESLSVETGHVSIYVGSGATRCVCPVCGHGSSRIHSRYHRTVSDLPWHGSRVTFEIRARRFFCGEPSCERRIFCERLPEVATRALHVVALNRLRRDPRTRQAVRRQAHHRRQIQEGGHAVLKALHRPRGLPRDPTGRRSPRPTGLTHIGASRFGQFSYE